MHFTSYYRNLDIPVIQNTYLALYICYSRQVQVGVKCSSTELHVVCVTSECCVRIRVNDANSLVSSEQDKPSTGRYLKVIARFPNNESIRNMCQC